MFLKQEMEFFPGNGIISQISIPLIKKIFKTVFKVLELFHLFPLLASKTRFSKQEMELFHQFLELGSKKSSNI